jgi:hypothetical protein
VEKFAVERSISSVDTRTGNCNANLPRFRLEFMDVTAPALPL